MPTTQERHMRRSVASIIENNTKIIYCILRAGYWLSKLLGVTAFTYHNCSNNEKPHNGNKSSRQRYNRQFCRIRHSHFWRLYSHTALLLTIVALPLATATLYAEMQFLRQTALLSLVGYSRYVMLQVCTVGTLIRQSWKQRVAVKCLRRMLQLRRALRTAAKRHFGRRLPQFDRPSALLLCLKLLPLLCSPVWTLFVALHDSAQQRLGYLAALLFIYYCQLVLQLTLNMHFAGTLLLAGHAQQLNTLLCSALNAAGRHLHGNRPPKAHERQQLHCLADALSRLRRQHAHTAQLSRQLNRLYGPNVLALLAFVLFESVVQLFIVYFAAYSNNRQQLEQQEQRSFHTPVLDINPYTVVYVASLLADMCLVVCATQQLQSRLLATRTVLAESRAYLPQCGPWRCRLRCGRSIETQLDEAQQRGKQQQFAYTACGLFALDRRLLFAVCETILTYLLILIQYDQIYTTQ